MLQILLGMAAGDTPYHHNTHHRNMPPRHSTTTTTNHRHTRHHTHTQRLIVSARWPAARSLFLLTRALLMTSSHAKANNTVSLPESWKPGLKFCTTTALRAGIVCVGAKLSVVDVAAVGAAGIPAVVLTVGTGTKRRNLTTREP